MIELTTRSAFFFEPEIHHAIKVKAANPSARVYRFFEALGGKSIWSDNYGLGG